ncbi:MAG: heat-inducible transcriptional repressor HrcA [Gammaproteobacteria bacterium]|nr:heat-inducible transcriptional repressor HrcA [Gammaproteobacteria bacterium]
MSERAQYFLKVLIERYIRDGQPVGSRTLAKDAGLDLSPATIRNVMADLEDLGFVASPHTSAGRVPTVSGYRMFVDSLLSLKPLDKAMLRQVQSQLDKGREAPSGLVDSASRLLSNLTHLAGVVMVPKQNQIKVRQIEFVALSELRVLTVIVTSAGEVYNRIIETSRPFSRSELEQLSNYVTAHYAGHDLADIRRLVLREMQETKRNLDALMMQAMEMAKAVFAEGEDDGGGDGDFVVAGQTNLMDFDELAQVDSLRSLFNAFTEKQEILHLLDRSLEADGVQIFIGEESGYSTLKDCSVITAPYEVDSEVIGVLGVIGPTRMAYGRVIPIVDITAKVLGSALGTR